MAAAALFVLISQSLKRLRRITVAMTALAADDLFIEIPDTNRNDDYGEMARIIQVFKMLTQNSTRWRQRRERCKQATEERKNAARNGYRF